MGIIHIRITAYIYAERDRGPAVIRLARMNIEQKDACAQFAYAKRLNKVR